MIHVTLEQELQKFKFDVLRKMPFYGDILMRLNIVENNSFPTAATNGLSIMYNSKFMSRLSPGERNYVMMHEVFHVLLMHCKRNPNKNNKLWNVACDMVVNNMLDKLTSSMRNAGIAFERPRDGVFANLSDSDTVENIYQKLSEQNKNRKSMEVYNRILIVKPNGTHTEISAPDDLIMESDEADVILGDGKASGSGQPLDNFNDVELSIKEIVREATTKNRGTMGSYFVPDFLYNLTESKKLPWQKLLKDFFTEEISDDASYTTPERKYIHMDLILPGHCLTDTVIEEVWAFVDSSGSISKKEMEEFLTQLYRISKEFKCKFNICYWDTKVTDVYKNILKESDIIKCLPKHSGGTDINCVYEWMKENHVRPEIMLILTDGYFGSVQDKNFLSRYKKKTIMVLNSDIRITDEMNKIGKITRL